MSLPKGEIIRESWKLTRKHLGFLCLAGAPSVLTVIAEIVISAIGGHRNPHFHRKLVEWISSPFTIVAQIGMIGVALRVVRGGTPNWSDFAAPYKKLWRLFLIELATDVPFRITFFAFLLSPFIGFADFLAFDRNLSFLQAFKESVRWTMREWWSVLILCLFMDVAGIAGFLFLGVGVFVSFPFVWIVQAKTYDALRLQIETASDSVIAP